VVLRVSTDAVGSRLNAGGGADLLAPRRREGPVRHGLRAHVGPDPGLELVVLHVDVEVLLDAGEPLFLGLHRLGEVAPGHGGEQVGQVLAGDGRSRGGIDDRQQPAQYLGMRLLGLLSGELAVQRAAQGGEVDQHGPGVGGGIAGPPVQQLGAGDGVLVEVCARVLDAHPRAEQDCRPLGVREVYRGIVCGRRGFYGSGEDRGHHCDGDQGSRPSGSRPEQVHGEQASSVARAGRQRNQGSNVRMIVCPIAHWPGKPETDLDQVSGARANTTHQSRERSNHLNAD
jgi:hypothetical protein